MASRALTGNTVNFGNCLVSNNHNPEGSALQVDSANETKLVRGLGLYQSIALNIANMVGIGPFITIPLFLAAMHGPQALIAWVIAAVLVICDGLVWSELGAALPGSGGTYHFLREIFGKKTTGWGRMLPFLFVWQFLVSGTMEIASGYIGAVPYLKYIFPELSNLLSEWHIPGGTNTLAAVGCLIVTWMLSRRIEVVRTRSLRGNAAHGRDRHRLWTGEFQRFAHHVSTGRVPNQRDLVQRFGSCHADRDL